MCIIEDLSASWWVCSFDSFTRSAVAEEEIGETEAGARDLSPCIPAFWDRMSLGNKNKLLK